MGRWYRGVVLAWMLTAAAVGASEARADTQARIAFSSAGRLLSIDADGSDRRQLLLAASGAAAHPVYSPDGERIAFMREVKRKGEDGSQIVVMDESGANPRPVTQPGRRKFDIGPPEWSPDGRQIAFAQFVLKRRKVLSSIAVVAAGGGPVRTVFSRKFGRAGSVVGEPTWSPDGRQIAFTQTSYDYDAYEARTDVYVVPVQGGEARLLVADASGADWSPDGSRLALVSGRDRNGQYCPGEVCYPSGEIYVAKANGTGLTRLTENEGNDALPDWSADGARIAFSSDRNGGDELYSIEPDGECLTWLTNGSPGSGAPSWRPDPGADTDPGGCGAVPRPPLVEYDAGPAKDVDRHQVMWLGKQYGTSLLSWVIVDRYGAFLEYADCARFDPADCDPGFFVDSSWVCERGSIDTFLSSSIYADIFLNQRGTFASYEWFEGGLIGYGGKTRVIVDFGGDDTWSFEYGLGLHQDAFDALYDVRESGPSGDFARATIPIQVLHWTRELVRLRKRLGSIQAVKRKHRRIPPYLVRNAVVLDKALDEYGPVDTVRCPRRTTKRAITLRPKREPAAAASAAARAARAPATPSDLPEPILESLRRAARR